MPPPSSYDAVFAQQERRDLGVENGDLVEKKQCRPRPGSAWCTEDNTNGGKRAFMVIYDFIALRMFAVL